MAVSSKKKPVKKVAPRDGLTVKERQFVAFYLGESRFNATDAARKAGYGGDDNTLGVIGHQNLRKAKIRAFIDAELSARAMTANECLSELADIAKSPWREFVEITYEDGEPLLAKLRLTDKLKALELLGKYHKLFADRTEHEGSVTVKVEYVGA